MLTEADESSARTIPATAIDGSPAGARKTTVPPAAPMLPAHGVNGFLAPPPHNAGHNDGEGQGDCHLRRSHHGKQIHAGKDIAKVEKLGGTGGTGAGDEQDRTDAEDHEGQVGFQRSGALPQRDPRDPAADLFTADNIGSCVMAPTRQPYGTLTRL